MTKARPRLLDLYCCAGGAASGYESAGFAVYGVDIDPQPHYPFPFHLGDALIVLALLLSGVEVEFMGVDGGTEMLRLSDFVAVHSSPPCQKFTAYRRKGNGVGDGYLNLIPETRELLIVTGLPYVIENVEGAASELVTPVRLCGSSFGLDVRRHRLFESNIVMLTPPCDHSWQKPRYKSSTGRENLRKTVEVGVWRIPLDVQQEAMGIDWMTLHELSEAIPPAFTTWIGERMLDHLSALV